jgi:hypothetical protein
MNIGDLRDVIVAFLSQFQRLGSPATWENRIVERGDTVTAKFFTARHLYELVVGPHNLVCTGFALSVDGMPEKTGIPIYSGPADAEELRKLAVAILDRELIPYNELAAAQTRVLTTAAAGPP